MFETATLVDSGVGDVVMIARIRDSMYEHTLTNGDHCLQTLGMSCTPLYRG